MYSDKIQERLDEEDIEVGDRVKADSYEGQLMPKPSSGNPEILVVKLDSGYNIGVKTDDIKLVEKNDGGDRELESVEHSEDQDNILVLHTGGTIASRVSYEEGGVKPAFDPEELLEMYPEIGEEANIHSEVVAQMLSEDMEPEHWQQVARTIDEVKDDYDGIIVGHGTDTMAYTGAALKLMLQNIDTGVLLVGAQRSSDRPSSDASINMYSAVKFLKETEFQGIGVCMHESSDDRYCNILNAAKIRKMHTSRRDAFKPINSEIIGRVDYQKDRVDLDDKKASVETYSLKENIERNVGVLKVRPGMKPDEIDFLIEQDYDGVVIEGTGLGHMPVNSFDEYTEHHKQILEKLDELADKSLVVMSSQCLNGRVNMNVYDAGLKIQEAGVIQAEDMHPELAYVKLMWSLGNADSREDAKDLFKSNIAGELKPRSHYSEEN